DFSAGTSVQQFVEVDETLYDLADELPAGAEAGDQVQISVEADPAIPVADALALATAPGGSAQTQVLEVTADSVGPHAADLSTGTHELVVLPVTWSGIDPGGQPTQAQLTTTAIGAAAYWQRQSNGRLTMTASVRAWKSIPKPAS